MTRSSPSPAGSTRRRSRTASLRPVVRVRTFGHVARGVVPRIDPRTVAADWAAESPTTGRAARWPGCACACEPRWPRWSCPPPRVQLPRESSLQVRSFLGARDQAILQQALVIVDQPMQAVVRDTSGPCRWSDTPRTRCHAPAGCPRGRRYRRTSRGWRRRWCRFSTAAA